MKKYTEGFLEGENLDAAFEVIAGSVPPLFELETTISPGLCIVKTTCFTSRKGYNKLRKLIKKQEEESTKEYEMGDAEK